MALAKDHITVWPFDKAPEEIQKIASQGGDEDWIVFVPKGMSDDYTPHWIDATDACNEPKRIEHEAGIIYVGCHA